MLTSRRLISTHQQPIRRPVAVRASLAQVLNEQSYLIGKGITLFVGFYCGLQYFYYKEARERIEKEQEAKKDKEKNGKKNTD